MSSQNVTQVLGIVVLARGGDRQTLYLAPDDYASSLSSITPLGEQQEFQLGGSLRSIYLNVTSPSFVQGIFGATALFNQSSVIVQSDDAGEDGTLFDGAQALMQGLWPPSQQEAIFLANGTTITSPLGGYQYIPIDSVDPDEDISLEGAPSCTAWSMRNEAFYNSAGFLEKANQSTSLLSALQPYLDGRPVNLENMWNVYDYMNVQFIHNATYAGQLPPAYMEQVRDLANWHEYNVFTDTAASGIGNIAGRVMLPSILNTLQRISNPLDGLKMQFSAISYQPFLSLMNMTGMFESGQVPPAIVEYAAALVLEVRQPFGGGEPVVRANFKNGTDDEFHIVDMIFDNWNGSGGQDVPLSDFVAAFQEVGVNSTVAWCNTCQQAVQRGCQQALAPIVPTTPEGAASSTLTSSSHMFSPVGAGFLGAGLATLLLSALLGLLLFAGVLSYGGIWRLRRLSYISRRSRDWRGDEMELHSEVNSVVGLKMPHS